MTKRRWDIVLDLGPGQLRFFALDVGEDLPPLDRPLAVCDRSGSNPDETDDGALFVRRDEIIANGGLRLDERGRCIVPLIRYRDQRRFSTIMPLACGPRFLETCMKAEDVYHHSLGLVMDTAYGAWTLRPDSTPWRGLGNGLEDDWHSTDGEEVA